MSEMTIEEARRILIDIADQMPSDVCADWIDAVCIGIKAIDAQLMRDATEEERKSVKDYIELISKPTGVHFYEVQPCEDAVSREAVKNGMIKYGFHAPDMTVTEFVEDCLPSVKPKYTDEEIDKIQTLEQAYVDKMVELAVEEVRRPRGKWIRITNGPMREKYMCSECGRQIEEDGIEELIAIKYPYCHCGAEMSGGNKDEDSN